MEVIKKDIKQGKKMHDNLDHANTGTVENLVE